MTRHVLTRDVVLNAPGQWRRTSLIGWPEDPISFHLAAGESRRLRGHLEARNEGFRAELRATIRCFDAGGSLIDDARTSRNHEGTDADLGLDPPAPGHPRVGYPSPGVLAIDVNHLFIAPRTGRFGCRLEAVANPKRSDTADVMVALQDVTWLEISEPHDEDHGNRRWVLGSDLDSPLPGACASKGIRPTCSFLMPPADTAAQPCPIGDRYDRSALVFDGLAERWNPTALFEPSATAGSVVVIADLELTGCHRSLSCAEELKECSARKSPSMVRTRLEVIPVIDDGHLLPCRRASFEPSPGYRTTVIPPRTHHMKVHHELQVPVPPTEACGPQPKLLIRIAVESIGGNPVKIDANRLTSVFAMNAP